MSKRPLKLVIAEDSKEFRKRLLQYISQISGITVVGVAQTTREALESIKEHKPELALLDIQMPDKSTLEVIQEIKQIHPEITIIFLTNLSSPQIRKESLRRGVDYFFDKSTEFDQAMKLLEELSTRIS